MWVPFVTSDRPNVPNRRAVVLWKEKAYRKYDGIDVGNVLGCEMEGLMVKRKASVVPIG